MYLTRRDWVYVWEGSVGGFMQVVELIHGCILRCDIRVRGREDLGWRLGMVDGVVERMGKVVWRYYECVTGSVFEF